MTRARNILLRKLAATGLVAAMLGASNPALGAVPSHQNPKIANFYLRWTVSEGEARELSKWDVVFLDMEVGSRTPDSIRLMRSLNPNIKILAYITASEIRTDAASLGAASPLRARLASRLAPEWYLSDASGNRRSFWAGTWILNVTDRAPLIGGKRWNDVLPEFVRDEIYSTGLWDGVVYDNAWKNIIFFAGTNVDLNRDGRAEGIREADEAWRSGLRTIYAKTRALLPAGALVTENDGPLYAPHVSGLLFENFPRNGWKTTLDKVASANSTTLTPRIVVVNSNTGNTGRREDYKRFRFGLASALLHDAYYSFDYGDQDHGPAWSYDEYGAVLGAALPGPVRVDSGPGVGVWRRDYEQGVVVANASAEPKTIRFRGEVERLRGTQDSTVNSGLITDEVTLDREEGIILLRPLGKIVGAAFRNGSMARVFNIDGRVARAGVFTFDRRAPSGAEVLVRDLGSDGVGETLIATSNALEVLDNGGRRIFKIFPYGQSFSGGVAAAVGALDGDRRPEIVTVTARSGGARVRIHNSRGQLIRPEFPAYDPRFQGGASVAVGDLDGDGQGEIVIGAGPGGGPHVRVFDGNGNLKLSGFFAYDPRFRGGVRVAAGDLNGDGKAEIVTRAGPGGGPHVRVFDGGGRPQSGFFAFESTGRGGVEVGAADTNGDGISEVLAFSSDVFTVTP